MINNELFKIIGMDRDTSESSYSNKYAYEIKNMRLLNSDGNTKMSLVNEKGNKQLYIEGVGNNIYGIPIGQTTINNNLIIFTCKEEDPTVNLENIENSEYNLSANDYCQIKDVETDYEDRIYKIWFENNDLKGTTLYKGNLNFDYHYPIECQVYYENENIQKVYWVDGLNQTRVININTDKYKRNWNDYSFDFIRRLQLNENIEITKIYSAGGVFNPGVVQYAFSYFNKYGQESNIFYMSPIYYTSKEDKGEEPNKTVGNVFSIKVNNVDRQFEFLRTYCIFRTALDKSPQVRKVVDMSIPKVGTLQVFTKTEKTHSVINSNKSYTPSVYPIDNEQAGEQFYMHDSNYVTLDTYIDEKNLMTGKLVCKNIYKLLIREYIDSKGIRTCTYIYINNNENLDINIKWDRTEGWKIYSDTEFDVIYEKAEEVVDIKFTDNGLIGEILGDTVLQYSGGEDTIFGTIAQKDNTLFLGDIKLNRKLIDKDVREYFKGKSINYLANKKLDLDNPSGYYPYSIQLDKNNSQITTYKYLEYYRFGVQFQHITGKWSEPIWIKDVRNETPITENSDNSVNLITAEMSINSSELNSVVKKLVNNKYVKARPVVVFPEFYERESICQGVLNPTLFNVGDRDRNAPFAQSSWSFRPNAPFDVNKSSTILYCSTVDMNNDIKNLLFDDNGELKVKIVGCWINIKVNYGDKLEYEGSTDTWKTLPLNLNLWSFAKNEHGDAIGFTFKNCDIDTYLYLLRGAGDSPKPEENFPLTYCSNFQLNIRYKENGNTTTLKRFNSCVFGLIGMDLNKLGEGNEYSEISRGGSITIQNFKVAYGESSLDYLNKFNFINKGSWYEFRHNRPIPDNLKRNAEIQSICNPPKFPVIPVKEKGNIPDEQWLNSWIQINEDNYYVDQSIVTLHSPDIEFDDNLSSIDYSNIKLRIVGVVPITSSASDIDIITSSSTNPFFTSSESDTGKAISFPKGLFKYNMNIENNLKGNSLFAWRGMISGPFWFDEFTNPKHKNGSWNDRCQATGFAVYPWHRNGSLNNSKISDDNGNKTAMLKNKIMSNLKFSYNTKFINTRWKKELYDSKVFNSEENVLLKLKSKNNEYIYYSGNVDKALLYSKDKRNEIFDDLVINSKTLNYKYFLTHNKFIDTYFGYPIVVTGKSTTYDSEEYDYTNSNNKNYVAEKMTDEELFLYKYHYINKTRLDQDTSKRFLSGIDPVRINYKVTPHIVLNLKDTVNNKTTILPTFYDYSSNYNKGNEYGVNLIEKLPSNVVKPGAILSGIEHVEDVVMHYYNYWDLKKGEKIEYNNVSQEILDLSSIEGPFEKGSKGVQYGFLWLGELYRESVPNRFGGTTEEAFENNNWLPAGESVNLLDSNNNPVNSIKLVWNQGDTYYQRYDHVKSYPVEQTQQNANIDILSFMCETRINLDGRYDNNRGLTSYLGFNRTKFNQLNTVYNQKNNYFSFPYINYDNFNIDIFNNSLTWTKTKMAGEEIDTWTNITMVSTLDLDGDKGKLRSIKRYNNNIIAFQDKGICQILFNENMQITTTSGVPIEISNSNKVTGKRYITDKLGCSNKWSICETSNGLYFIDDITKGIYIYGEKLDQISDKLGFRSWVQENSTTESWNPVDFNNIVTYYNKATGDVYFINKDYCLCFSEPLANFTSFYSYEKTPYFSMLNDKCLSINISSALNGKYKLWLQNEGDYNYFFDKYNPFYVTVLMNKNFYIEKIFNNIEFHSDSWYENKLLDETFDYLEIWNEYQRGKAVLTKLKGYSSNLKKKFRTWRAIIPRDGSNKRDRIRNTWAYIKLSKEKENKNKTVLHDLLVQYF